MEYNSPHPGFLATLCGILLLCATFAYFWPIPTAKCTRLRPTFAPVARAERQSTSATCGGGCVEYSCPHPRFLAALCSFLLLFTTFATFAYILPVPTAIRHPPTANLCSSCTRPAPEQLYHVWEWPCGIQLSKPRASCNVMLLFATLCYFCYFCLRFANTRSHKAPTYSSPLLQLHAPGARAPLQRVGLAVWVQLLTPRAYYSFVQLFFLSATFVTLCYFYLLFANTRNQTHPPTAHL